MEFNNPILPKYVEHVLDRFRRCGFEAFLVGGCVRDFLLKRTPKDFDVCTNATPDEIKNCFNDTRLVETGVRHGTLSLIFGFDKIEVTTYRAEEGFSDLRRPDKVIFVDDIKQDLSRRDFTVNAMAFNRDCGLVDPFGGYSDLKSGIIRTVGDARIRFSEDGLRVMRALRFASVLGFDIDSDTSEAIIEFRHLLSKISKERVSSELSMLLLGDNVENILINYSKVFEVIIPEIGPSIGFEQYNKYHNLDVYTHSAKAVSCSVPRLIVRLALLLHDIAKPKCFTIDKEGIDHFYRHNELGQEISMDILKRLRYDNETIKSVGKLVYYHGCDVAPDKKAVKRWLNKLGEDQFRCLLEVKYADFMAQSGIELEGRTNAIEEIKVLLEEINEEGSCITVKDLALTGDDLIKMGVPQGKQIGRILSALLDMVLNETLPNNKDDLLKTSKEVYNDLR